MLQGRSVKLKTNLLLQLLVKSHALEVLVVLHDFQSLRGVLAVLRLSQHDKSRTIRGTNISD